MSHFREDTLTALQEDLKWPLKADEYFADINVFDFHQKNLEHAITNALGVLTPMAAGVANPAGKIGACVVVMPLTAVDDYRDASHNHPLTVRVTYRVCEDPVLNKGTNGTQKPALSICSRVRRVLKNQILGGYAEGLVPDGEQFIVPVEDGIAPLCYDVNFVTLEKVDQNVERVCMPVFAYDDTNAQVTLSCDTPNATIYYTLDGAYPHPLNTGHGVTAYTGPFTIEGEVLVRAAAFWEAHLPSHVAALRMSLIGSQDGGAGLGAIS